MNQLSAFIRFAPVRLFLALAWSALLTLLLLQTEADPVINLGLPRGDNTLARELAFSTIHLLAFGGTCLCWFWALPKAWRPRAALVVSVSITIALGIATEFLQSFTPDRYASWIDLVANISGAVGAAKLIWMRHAPP